MHQIVGETAAPEREALFAWWRYHPDAFRIVRDRDGGACGLCVMIRASDLNEAVDASDPVAAAWRRDVVTAGPIGCALLPTLARSGRWRSSVRVAGASWVDLKRSYVEMRGTLRWVYTVIANPEPFGEVPARLGFRPLAEPTIDVGGQTLYSVMLDMGPGSVDAWLTKWLELKSRRRKSSPRKCSMSRPMSSY